MTRPACRSPTGWWRSGATVQAFDPTVDADGRESADDLRGLELRADPYEAATGARVLVVLTEWDEFRWLDFARVLALMAEPSIVDARNLLDPAAVRRMGFRYTGSAASEPGRRGRRRRLPRLAPVRPPVERGDTVVCLDDLSTGSRENVAHLLGHDRFSLVVADVSEKVELDEAATVDAVCNLASPASPPAYLARPLETLAVGSEGTRRLLELARDHGARFLMASTSEIYGDPEVHPQVESYRGNVDPIGPAQRLRRGQALRREPDHGDAPRARGRRGHRPDLQHLRPAALARATAGSSPTSSSRRCAASRSPSTATGARRGASASSTTRSAACWRCSTRR